MATFQANPSRMNDEDMALAQEASAMRNDMGGPNPAGNPYNRTLVEAQRGYVPVNQDVTALERLPPAQQGMWMQGRGGNIAQVSPTTPSVQFPSSYGPNGEPIYTSATETPRGPGGLPMTPEMAIESAAAYRQWAQGQRGGMQPTQQGQQTAQQQSIPAVVPAQPNAPSGVANLSVSQANQLAQVDPQALNPNDPLYGVPLPKEPPSFAEARRVWSIYNARGRRGDVPAQYTEALGMGETMHQIEQLRQRIKVTQGTQAKNDLRQELAGLQSKMASYDRQAKEYTAALQNRAAMRTALKAKELEEQSKGALTQAQAMSLQIEADKVKYDAQNKALEIANKATASNLLATQEALQNNFKNGMAPTLRVFGAKWRNADKNDISARAKDIRTLFQELGLNLGTINDETGAPYANDEAQMVYLMESLFDDKGMPKTNSDAFKRIMDAYVNKYMAMGGATAQTQTQPTQTQAASGAEPWVAPENVKRISKPEKSLGERVLRGIGEAVSYVVPGGYLLQEEQAKQDAEKAVYGGDIKGLYNLRNF